MVDGAYEQKFRYGIGTVKVAVFIFVLMSILFFFLIVLCLDENFYFSNCAELSVIFVIFSSVFALFLKGVTMYFWGWLTFDDIGLSVIIGNSKRQVAWEEIETISSNYKIIVDSLSSPVLAKSLIDSTLADATLAELDGDSSKRAATNALAAISVDPWTIHIILKDNSAKPVVLAGTMFFNQKKVFSEINKIFSTYLKDRLMADL